MIVELGIAVVAAGIGYASRGNKASAELASLKAEAATIHTELLNAELNASADVAPLYDKAKSFIEGVYTKL